MPSTESCDLVDNSDTVELSIAAPEKLARSPFTWQIHMT